MWREISRMSNDEKSDCKDSIVFQLIPSNEYIDLKEQFNDMDVHKKISIIDFLLNNNYEILTRNDCIIKVYDIMADEFICEDNLDSFIEREIQHFLSS